MIRLHKSAQDGWLQKTILPPTLIPGSAPLTKFICAVKVQSHTTSALAVAKPSTPEFMKD